MLIKKIKVKESDLLMTYKKLNNLSHQLIPNIMKDKISLNKFHLTRISSYRLGDKLKNKYSKLRRQLKLKILE